MCSSHFPLVFQVSPCSFEFSSSSFDSHFCTDHIPPSACFSVWVLIFGWVPVLVPGENYLNAGGVPEELWCGVVGVLVLCVVGCPVMIHSRVGGFVQGFTTVGFDLDEEGVASGCYSFLED